MCDCSVKINIFKSNQVCVKFLNGLIKKIDKVFFNLDFFLFDFEKMDSGYTSNETDSAVSSAISIGDKAGPGPLLLKILVPAYAAGSIIGNLTSIINTVVSGNSHTPNIHTYPNSHTLFGLTRM